MKPHSLIYEDKKEDNISPDAWPFVTIIIPTFNNSANLSPTLDSLLEQDYSHFEIIAVDAGSSDRTLEILHSYGDLVQLVSADHYNIHEMINTGIKKSHGEYINFLFPGDFYIHHHTLKDVMRLAVHQGKPHLVYCGALLRDGQSEVKFLFRPLSFKFLQKGQQPTSLQGCWIKKETFDKIGLFKTQYKLRGGFEFFCRFCKYPKLHVASLHRALTDYNLRWVTRRMVMRHFWETWKIIYENFGWAVAFKWLFVQKDIHRFLKLWKRHVKIAFFGQ